MKLDTIVKEIIETGKGTPQKILIHGDAGTGKTALIASLVLEGYELILVDTENGFETLISHLPASLHHKVNVIRVRDTKATPWAIETCTKLMSGRPQKICVKHGRISCPDCIRNKDLLEEFNFSLLNTDTVVAFDSLTQIVESAKAVATTNLPVDAKLEQDHWGRMGMYLAIFLGAVQQAPFHIVCTSHSQEIQAPDGSSKLYPVGGTRNASRQTARYFGHVVYTEIKNKIFRAASSAQHHPKVVAKSRADLAMETGNVSLGDLLIAKPKEGGASADIQEEIGAEGTVEVITKPVRLQDKMAALKVSAAIVSKAPPAPSSTPIPSNINNSIGLPK